MNRDAASSARPALEPPDVRLVHRDDDDPAVAGACVGAEMGG